MTKLPDEIKKLKGTYRPDRERKGIEPGARLAEVPPRLKGTSDLAADIFDELAGLLVGMGVLSDADLPALKLCAKTLATADELEAAIAEEGFTIPAATGGKKAHPALKALETQRNAAVRMLNDFGLSPKSRKYVSQAPKARADSMYAKYLKADRNAFDNLEDDDDWKPVN